jgi:mono/diheme cytochrome c family protein
MQNWYAPSLISNAEASVAAWDTSHVAALLKTGTTSKASVLGPMAEVVLGSTQHLTDADLNAIALYLKDLPQAPATTPPAVIAAVPEKKADLGTKLYDKYCAQCHGDKGQGVPGAYPPLAGNRSVTLTNSTNLLQIVIHGGFAPATAGNPRPYGMPPYRLLLNDADIAAVVTHIRTSWGNRASQVHEMDVSLLKSAPKR